MSTTSVDVTAIDQLWSLFGPETDQVLQSFHDDVPLRLAQMRGALDKNNHPELCRLAHNLKSSAGYVGAVAISETAARLERIERLDPADGPLLIGELEREAIRFRNTPLPHAQQVR